jgi:hypothetical protein
VQIDKGRIGCLGRGVGGLLGLYAAALDERLAAAAMWQAPLSYRSLILEQPGFPASTYLFDVLNHFDLPQLMAAVAPRALLVAEPVDGVREPLDPDAVKAALSWPDQVYHLLGAPRVDCQVSGATPPGRTAPTQIAEWMRCHLYAEAIPGRQGESGRPQ